MRYLPHTQEDVAAMLKRLGLFDLEELFSTIPDSCRRERPLDLPEPLTEWGLDRHMARLAQETGNAANYQVYLGAGSYEHYIPASISNLIGRSEFYTAYTPYQPEISQGTLQAMFEYQSLISRLMGMEVSNASLYDGASALAEALLMSLRIQKKKSSVGLSAAIHPHYRKVVASYFEPNTFRVVEQPYLANGRSDPSAFEGVDDLAAVAVQSPNFFGCIENLSAWAELARKKQALLIVVFTEPLAYGLLKNPGSFGADIVCGEGQSFGLPQSFGGPGLGVFCSKKQYVRNLPGRLVGETKDKHGQRGFVLTLATREQHIRRERATSNICSNQGLCATMAGMYLASLGGTGLRQLARLNRDKAEYLKQSLRRAGLSLPFSSPTFNEFVVQLKDNGRQKRRELLEKNIVFGLPLEEYYPELENHYLLCVTETKSRQELDNLAKEVAS